MKTDTTKTEQDVDLWGAHFSRQLTMATPSLPHDITERLRVARHLAMAQRKPQVQWRLAKLAQANSDGSLTASADEGLNVRNILASVLPLLVLVIGLMAIQWVQQDSITSEIAAIDAALLTDELPPDAYTDAGFAQFLKQGLNTSPVHD